MKLDIFIFGIAIINLIAVFQLLRKRTLNEHFAVLWIFIGVLGLAIALLRRLIDDVAASVGIKYGTSLIFSISIFFLLVLAMYFSLRITKLESQVEKLAETIALNSIEKKDKS